MSFTVNKKNYLDPYMFFFFFSCFFYRCFFVKNLIWGWVCIEILTFFSVFFLLYKNFDFFFLKNILKFLLIQAWIRFLFIFFFFFFQSPDVLFILFSIKLRRFPRHIWIPDLFPRFTILNILILLILPKIYPLFFFNFFFFFNPILIKCIAFLTMLIRSCRFLFSNNFKNFFAYSSVAQIGWFIICVTFSTDLIIFFFFTYIIILSFFYYFFLERKNITLQFHLILLIYRRLPLRLPLYLKFLPLVNYNIYFFFFFFLLLYYFFFFSFVRYTWNNTHFLFNNNKQSMHLSIILLPLFFFFFGF